MQENKFIEANIIYAGEVEVMRRTEIYIDGEKRMSRRNVRSKRHICATGEHAPCVIQVVGTRQALSMQRTFGAKALL